MRSIADLLRTERGTRLFFLAHAQSSLGTGAAYIGLLVLAFDRLHSPWAISLVLLADFLPAMLLGPLFGAAADRWSRRACAVAADVARALAFVSLAFLDSFGLTVALALLAGVGTGLFNPAVMAGMPRLVSKPRLPAATALYGALADLGFTLGPALAGAALLLANAETLMLVNGISFGVSALVLTRVDLGRAERVKDAGSLLADARAGLRSVASMPGIRTVVGGGAAVILFAGLFNVGELLLVKEELGAGASGFGLLVAFFGLGVVAGSVRGADAERHALKRRYLEGMAVTGCGFLVASFAPSLPMAAAGFLIAGFGNGLVVVHQRLLLQTAVGDGLLGRVFGFKDTLSAWAYVLAFLAAGILAGAAGTRALLVFAGVGVLTVAAASAWALRGLWTEVEPAPEGVAPQPLPQLVDRLDGTERPRPVTPAGRAKLREAGSTANG